ncbi:MAG: alpha/beta hydrolase-fold protein [Planctomycetota bacterium]
MTRLATRSTSLAALFLLLLAPAAFAADTEVVRFEQRQQTTWGESLYLLGDLPELGDGDPTRALRMVPGGNDQWSLSIALPKGADYRFTYVVRWNEPGTLASQGNARRVADILSARVPGTAAERAVKVRYLSGWGQVYLQHDGGQVVLRRAGQGRGPGESIWEGEVRTRARELAFELSDGGAGRDRAPNGQRYATRLADLTLVDGALHAGRPDLGSLEAKGSVVRVPGFGSQELGNRRDLFIYRPRGYSRSNKRYPVIYAHDGQNLFGPDALFGGWRLEDALDRGIAAGRIAEVIVVGVANTPDRMNEYMPEGDGGYAGRYARFLIDELKPWVDANLRTLSGREHTATLGSSLGGLVSFYLGWERADVFGKVGSLSGSFWLRGYVDRLGQTPKTPAKMWLDSGNQGGSAADSCEDTLWMRDQMLRRGLVLERDVHHFVHYGASHNEQYWRQRVGQVLEFLFPAE